MKSPLLALAAVLILLVLLHTVSSRPRHSTRKQPGPRNPEKFRTRLLPIKKTTTPKPLRDRTSSPLIDSIISLNPYTTTTPTTTTTATTTTTPPETTTPLCVEENGKNLLVGEEVKYDGGCRGCICTLEGLQCYYVDCMIRMCVDYIKPNTSCCGECPNGSNCFIKETGEIISEPVETDVMQCRCPDVSEHEYYSDRGPIAVCTPLTTTPPPPTRPPCVDDDGKVLVLGQHFMHSDGGSCRYCACELDGLVCYYGDCLPPMCFDYFLPNGGCCNECPSGQNCIIKETGEIITTRVERHGNVCWCPEQVFYFPGYPSPEYYTAICSPSNISTTSTPRIIEDTFTTSSEPWTYTDATVTTSLEPWTSTDTSTPAEV